MDLVIEDMKDDEKENIEEEIVIIEDEIVLEDKIDKPEPKKEIPEPEEKDEVKPPAPFRSPLKTDAHGPLDRGGVSNKKLHNLRKSVTNDTISSLEAELYRYQSEHAKLPMPRGDSKIKRKRYVANAKIKKIQKKLDAYKISQVNKEPVNDTNVDKFERLAGQMNYRTKNMKHMTKYQFEQEKRNIMDKADREYTQPAKIITEWILVISQGTDTYKMISGYSINLKKNRKHIEMQVKKCLIHEGMKGKNMSDLFANPYIGLGIALCLPLASTYFQNKSPEKKKGRPGVVISNKKS